MKQSEQSNDEIKQQILFLIEEARSLKSSNLAEAIAKLNTAQGLVCKLPGKQQQSSQHEVAKTTKTETDYFVLLSTLLYEAEEYKGVLDACKNLEQMLSGRPTEYIVYRIEGDAYRKQEKYKESIDAYSKGLELCKSQQYKTILANNRALSHLGLHQHDKALQDLDFALEVMPEDPLYHCNKGNVLYALQRKADSLESFKKASTLIKAGKVGTLDKNNIAFIDSTLHKFLDQLEALNAIKLQKDDKVLSIREADKVNQFVTNLIDNKYLQDENDSVIKAKQQVAQIEKDQLLYEYYDGFLFTITQAYDSSKMILSGNISINSGDVTDAIISKIPFIGSQVVSLKNFVKEACIIRSATNLSKMAPRSEDFGSIAQDTVFSILNARKDQLKNITPDKYILKSFTSRVQQKLKDFKEKIEEKIYGTRYDTPMQKLGYKEACDIVSKIGDGEIYGEEIPIKIPRSEKQQRLLNLSIKVIDEDINDQNKDFVPPQQEEDSSCFIYAVIQQKYYDPEIEFFVKNPDAREVGNILGKYGIENAFDYSA